MRKYLVTGGVGFIGSHLVDSLLKNGCKVKVYDDFSSGLMENIKDSFNLEDYHLRIIEGDIRDREKLYEAMRGVDGVFHLAALVSVPQSIERPDLSFDVNSKGTQIVLDLARQCGINRVVLASSAAVYGNYQILQLRRVS